MVEEVKVAHPDREMTAGFDLPPSVVADHLRIAQMTSNLLSNAVTHGDPLTPIEVSAHARAGTIEICVTNGGRPIPPEQIEKLFLPFKHGDGKAGVQGLGLGLYIASQIAQAHGGRIDVRSDEQETCFTFSMPSKVS